MKPSRLCQHLRTKKMFVPEHADEVFARDNGVFTGTSPCWCNRTLAGVGPDNKQVSVQVCSPSRSCFEE
jgi:hypothetical protein